MRILIASDLHANLEALAALPRDCDALWILGDLVNYGPDPAEVVRYVRQHATAVVCGNHDYAIAHAADPRCSPRFRAMAEETARYTRACLDADDVAYLASLPPELRMEADGRRALLCHAAPLRPLYEYRAPDSAAWFGEWPGDAWHDLLLTGHTHVPFVRTDRGRTVLNPGSVGQPKHGRPLACYAVWEDGKLQLAEADYDYEATIRKLDGMPLSATVRRDLAAVLSTGRAPI